MTQTHDLFLPNLRQGLAGQITEPTSPGAQRAQVNVKLTVSAHIVNSDNTTDKELSLAVELYGPGDILGFDPRIVVRTDPKPDDGNFEPNYFPLIELADPDFLWRFTPARATQEHPWPLPCITLIVLNATPVNATERQEFTEGKQPDRNLPPFIQNVAVANLPDLSKAWRWAHVHVTVGEDEISKENLAQSREKLMQFLGERPGRAVCRLLCPRRLASKTQYAAFIVPGFEMGRCAGRGQPFQGTNATELAWNSGKAGEVVELPYYYRWDFQTGEGGDFESLVRLLKPRKLEGLGVRNMDCTTPGFGTHGVDTPGLEGNLGLEGALQSLNMAYTAWGRDRATDQASKGPEGLQKEIADLINANSGTCALVIKETAQIRNVSLQASSGDTSVEVSCHTPTPSNCFIRFGYGNLVRYGYVKQELGVKTDHYFQLPGLIPGSIYHFMLQARDQKGNTAKTDPGFFSILRMPYSVPPMPDGVQPMPYLLPPIYGRWHSGVNYVDYKRNSWADQLNLDPRHRVAAGLGAQVVREQQELLMASAWDQLGAIERANDLLRRAQLGREILAQGVYPRMSTLSPENLLLITAPVQPRVLYEFEKDGQPTKISARYFLHTQSRIPAAALDSAFRHLAGPRAPIGKRQGITDRRTLLTKLATGELEAAGPAPKPFGARRLLPGVIRIEPETLDFGSVKVYASQTLKAKLRNIGNDDLIITDIHKGPDTAQAFSFSMPVLPITLKPDSSVEVELAVTYAPTASGDQDSASVIIESNSPVKPSVTLLLQGIGVEQPQPDIDVWPLTLNFLVYIDEGQPPKTQTLSVKVFNLGNAELVITAINKGCLSSPFNLPGGTPISILPGQSKLLSFVYAPTVATESSDTVTISSNDPDEPTVKLELHGQAWPTVTLIPSGVSGSTAAHATTAQGAVAAPIGKASTVAPPPVRGPEFIAQFGATVLSALNPEITIVDRTRARLNLSPDLIRSTQKTANRDPLDTIMAAPTFEQAMCEPLLEISHELLLPGVEKVPQNTIGLLKTNRRFMEAYLCGCNHEFAGELLWRGYPTDQRGSYFRQFWDVRQYVPSGLEDNLLQSWLAARGAKSVGELSKEEQDWFIRRYKAQGGSTAGRTPEEIVTAQIEKELQNLEAGLLGAWLQDHGLKAIAELSKEEKIAVLNRHTSEIGDISRYTKEELTEPEKQELDDWVTKLVKREEKLKDVPRLVTWRSVLGQNENKPIEILKNNIFNELPEDKVSRSDNLVLVIRGDLLRRYPDASIYLIEAVDELPALPEYLRSLLFSLPSDSLLEFESPMVSDAVRAAIERNGLALSSNCVVNPIKRASGAAWQLLDPDHNRQYFVVHDVAGLKVYLEGDAKQPILPSFRATLPPDLTFLGFPLDKDAAKDMYFIIEQPVSQPRFGLDENRESLQSWADLSWTDFKTDKGEPLAVGNYLDAGNLVNKPDPENREGKDWDENSNSATRAWITLQNPVRVAVRVSELIPGEIGQAG